MKKLLLSVLFMIGCGSPPPPTQSECRVDNEACAVTSDCCQGLICTSNVCAMPAPPPPVCKTDGMLCSTTASCCGKLTCLANGKCGFPSLPPPPPPPPNTGLTWDVTDQYGATVYIRFYDTTASLVWPDNVNAYYLNQGQTGSYGLACVTGHQICYGASNADGSAFWGLGVNGDQSCASCCTTCNGGTAPVTLTP